MGDGTVFLVTGVGNYWGGKVAARLLQEEGVHIIGIDRLPPTDDISGLDFIVADSDNPLLAELLKSESVKALCHLDFTAAVEPNDEISQRNVGGLGDVLSACAEAGVQRVVVKSSTSVYGARPDNSVFLTEEAALRGSKGYGYTRDLLEVEAYCSGLRGQWPEVGLTVLRFANIIGAGAPTPMTSFLSRPSPPTLLGFDPIMQLVHEDDVVEALAYAMLNDRPGVFNVAADDAMPLSRILRLARRVPMPIPFRLAYRGLGMLGRAGLEPRQFVPIEWDYLRYSLVADLLRMHEDLAFSPIYTAAEALREFAGQQSEVEREDGGGMASDEQHLRDVIERRQRWRERQKGT